MERPPLRTQEEREPPAAGLTATLWLVVALIGIVELLLWFSRGIYG
jgi:hypothetical protein